jgi:hypothetical protein
MSCCGDVTYCVYVDNCYFFISLNSVFISCGRVEVGRVGGVGGVGRFVDIRGGVEGVEVEKIGVGVVIVIVIVIVVVVVIVVIVNGWMLRYWVDCCSVWDG